MEIKFLIAVYTFFSTYQSFSSTIAHSLFLQIFVHLLCAAFLEIDPYLEDAQCLMTSSVHPIAQFYLWEMSFV